MPALYYALDVFVLPSYREGFSRSAMEAAACETAMVLTDIRGCREIGEDGATCCWSRHGDATALTAAVQRLVDDADDATAARLRCRCPCARRVRPARQSLRGRCSTYAAVARRNASAGRWQEVSGAAAGG